jgi:hypothetical protein
VKGIGGRFNFKRKQDMRTIKEMKPEDCKHQRFFANCDITRLAEGGINDPVDKETAVITGYTADIKIHCTECGTAFEFIGVPGGSSPSHPCVSFDGTELRAPIRPANMPIQSADKKKLN